MPDFNLALDPSKFYKDAATGVTYTSQDSAIQNGVKIAPTIAPTTSPINSTAAPVSTGLPSLPQPTAPSITSGYVNSLNADLEAKRKLLEDTYTKQLENVKKQQAEAQAKIDEINKKQESTITQDVQPLLQPFQQTMETSERERLKVEENYFSNQKLTEELSTLLNQGNEAIRQTQDQSIPRVIGEAQLTRVMSDVSARAGVINAVMSARNNQIAQAYNLIDRSVAATTADRRDQLQYFSTLLDFYDNQKDEEGNKLLNLNADEKAVINDKVNLLKSDLDNAQATADYIKELMVSPDTAQIVAEAGVTLNDSVQAINKKLADYTVRKQKETDYKQNKADIAAAGITTQFAERNGELQRASDGFAFSTPEQFKQMTGLTVAEAKAKGMVSMMNANVLAEKQQVLALMETYTDAGIRPEDSLATAEQKLKSSKLYQEKFYHAPRSGDTSTAVTEVDSYAQAVYSGALKLTSVPQKIRAQVAAKTEELKKNASSKYETEFDARLDYDHDIQALQRDLSDPTVTLPPPTQIIEQLINDYGSRVSKQEIEATVLNIFGRSQRPAPATNPTSEPQPSGSLTVKTKDGQIVPS